MTIEKFRSIYGQAFYGFINSELGQAMLAVLKENDPADRLVGLPPTEQSANSTLFLGQVTGWRDCILTLQNQLIVGEGAPAEIEARYEPEELETFIPSPKESPSAPPAPPMADAPAPRRKKKK
jgi:hypothetical protein